MINVKAAGINPVDTYIRTGTHSVKPTLPYTPGKDGAGIVQQVGSDVTRTKVDWNSISITKIFVNIRFVLLLPSANSQGICHSRLSLPFVTAICQGIDINYLKKTNILGKI